MGLFDSKTEPATQKRREDARRKGQVAKSREIVSVLVLLAGFASLRAMGPAAWETFQTSMVYFFDAALGLRGRDALAQGVVRLVVPAVLLLLPLMLAVVIAGVAGNLLQTGPMLTGEGLKFDAKKLDPIAGIKKLVSAQAIVELLKSSAKLLVVGWAVWSWLKASYPAMLELSWMDLVSALTRSGELVKALVLRTLTALAVIAAIDYAWQRYSHEKQLMMTREEIRDELKQQEGSPEVRGAIRRRQREMARRLMASAVRGADVVVTNPTHYAVALKYDADQMDAPQVVARGQRLTALHIRELAEAAEVPIVENPPLARALFAACDVGDLVPPELYAAVAEVLAFVYRLRGHMPRS